MKVFTSGEKSAIRGGQYATAEFLLATFPEGAFGFWTGTSQITDAGQVYIPGANFIKVEAQGSGLDISARTLQVTLRGSTRAGLTPDVLATIDSYTYKNAPTLLSRAWFDRATGVLVKRVVLHRGYVDLIQKVRAKMGREMNLVASIEPRSIDHSRIGYRTRTPQDQRTIAATDSFFDRAALTPRLRLTYGKDSTGIDLRDHPGTFSGGPSR